MKESWIGKDKCTGCGACANICPCKAIEMRQDEYGFLKPVVLDTCIDCGLCQQLCEKRVCKGNDNSQEKIVYAAWSNDEELRKNSTSGGIFSELAKEILKRNGFIAGAIYTDECLVEHALISNIAELERLRKSKYIQSDSKNIYNIVKKYLMDGYEVLFCGTPCQVNALSAFLDGIDCSKLFLIDFICMGVNSPYAYKKWIEEIESVNRAKVVSVEFKNKTSGWRKSPFVTKLILDNNNKILLNKDDNYFMKAFLEQKVLLRPSCAKCDFKLDVRKADITLGDFWGIDINKDNDQGISSVIINSSKGKDLFDSIKDRIYVEQKTIEDVKRGNRHYSESAQISEKEKMFFELLHKMEFSKALGEIT
ncbi:Coenzyme F420 hydrogenase/dehydrogenase, beta subunit C-terminal domain [Butyrivibrio proteoclasticus]|uniref:Coenzyme F420 hydrogenase/dehydrogenase, beta subunit C-terminal domain n=1 Tax=Butyrivibrio proteoclasticus TaxID=43305 RepID=UPI000685A11D|nr:Coenzyme F420 hydrogenase/dehydrogenase, beta subunit C-terminal domain [Butyrivibrio proteoclasticus]